MALSRKELLKQDEVVGEVAGEASRWLEANWKTVAGVAAAVGGLALIVLLVMSYLSGQREKARELAGQGIAAFEQGAENFDDPNELSTALSRLEEAEARAGDSAAGHLAVYYQGATLMRLGRPADAATKLEPLLDDSPEETLTWTARDLWVDAAMEAGRHDDAISRLDGWMADSTQEAHLLVQKARVLRDRGDDGQARELLQRVVDDFAGTVSATMAQDLLGS